MSPFDRARYERLLKGLEATEKQLSELERTWRIDAEFFQRRHLRLAERLQKHRLESAAQVAAVSDGNHFSISESFVEEGIPYYRGQDVAGHFFIEQAEANTITREAFEQPFMKRSHLQQGDVLLSIVGTVGETSLVKSVREATCSCKLAILRPQGIAPEYLGAYLSSPVGKALSERWKRGAVQTGLLLEDMDQITVARFSEDFETAVKVAVDHSFAALEDGREFLRQAEFSLLHALGLDAWTPPVALSYVRSSSEAFAAGRFDAEHFQPRFAGLTAMMAARGNAERLGEHLLFNARGKQPEYADQGLTVINSKHVLRNEVRRDDENRLAAYDEDSLLIQSGDVLINGTGVGTIGRTAAYLHERPALPDNHVTILRPDGALDPVYLAVFLNSTAGQLQVEQRLRGSSGQIELYPSDIAEFRVWRAPKPVQLEIRGQVERSFAECQRANRLLDAAKHAVEIAVEESEQSALRYLGEVL